MSIVLQPQISVATSRRLRAQPRRQPEPATEFEHSGLLALLVTDLAGFTPMVERLGDVAARELIHEHNAIVRAALARCAGREVAHTGDGIIAAFRSVCAALDAAIAMQQQLAAHTCANPGAPLRARIGLHVGEPMPEEGRLFGACLNTAVRVCAATRAQHVLVSDLVRQLAAGRGFGFTDGGRVALKGLSEPMKLHELLWQPEATAEPLRLAR